MEELRPCSQFGEETVWSWDKVQRWKRHKSLKLCRHWSQTPKLGLWQGKSHFFWLIMFPLISFGSTKLSCGEFPFIIPSLIIWQKKKNMFLSFTVLFLFHTSFLHQFAPVFQHLNTIHSPPQFKRRPKVTQWRYLLFLPLLFISRSLKPSQMAALGAAVSSSSVQKKNAPHR